MPQVQSNSSVDDCFENHHIFFGHILMSGAAAGVDRLATWTYRGGYGTSVAAKDPIELWDNIGRNYKRVLKK